MPDLEDPPAPSAGSTPDAPTVSLWVIGVAVVVGLALAATLVRVLLSAPGATTAAAPGHPEQWDRRVVPTVKAVQRLRGLKFQHPVSVRFQKPGRFERGVTTDEKELTAADRRDLDVALGTMRALGLMRGKVDLLGEINQVSRSGILAYYSFQDQRITIRGRKLTPPVRSTLAHELAHALQDQHFAIGSRLDTLGRASEDGPDSSAASVLRAVVEGDAMRVEEAFGRSLPPRQRAAIDSGREAGADRADRRMAKVPTILQTMLSAPYSLGSGLVGIVATQDGNRAVNDLLRRTPAHENALLDPIRVLTRDTDVRPVPLLAPGPGEEELGAGELGALTWYLMFAERLPVADALAAVDGWAGDTHLTYESGGTACVRMAVRGQGRHGTDRFHEALRRWASSTPRTTRVSRSGGLVRLQSCDPGPRAPRGRDASRQALELVAVRAGLGIGMLRADASAHQARCLSRALLRTYPVEQLTDPEFGADDPAVQERTQQLAAGCR